MSNWEGSWRGKPCSAAESLLIGCQALAGPQDKHQAKRTVPVTLHPTLWFIVSFSLSANSSRNQRNRESLGWETRWGQQASVSPWLSVPKALARFWAVGRMWAAAAWDACWEEGIFSSKGVYPQPASLPFSRCLTLLFWSALASREDAKNIMPIPTQGGAGGAGAKGRASGDRPARTKLWLHHVPPPWSHITALRLSLPTCKTNMILGLTPAPPQRAGLWIKLAVVAI